VNEIGICKAMARTLYVCWMADAHDDDDDPFDAGDQAASMGADWINTADSDPPSHPDAWVEALITAGMVYQHYTATWGVSPFYVLHHASRDPEKWAHGAAMSSLGHGVCWSDDGSLVAPWDTRPGIKKGQDLPVPSGLAEHIENPFRGGTDGALNSQEAT
jgi:hypothetical protein